MNIQHITECFVSLSLHKAEVCTQENNLLRCTHDSRQFSVHKLLVFCLLFHSEAHLWALSYD